jgi:TPR repeat protein
MNVKIIQRQSSETGYTYQVPGHLRSTSDGNANCDANSYGYTTNVNCHGSGTTNTTISAPQTFSYNVTGATYSLLLLDGRIAVVNCASKSPSFMTGFAAGVATTNGSSNSVAMRRSCRTPLVDEIQVEFKGKNAKLKWPVSIDGKKYESETYTILAVLDRASKQGALPESHNSEVAPTASSHAKPSANIEPAPSAESIATLKEQAISGDAIAQYNLGEVYEEGQGVSQDYSQAAMWYRKAAEQGNADAQFDIGGLYYDGHGLSQDYVQAAIWYRKAAEQGNADAQSNLGLMYIDGRGVSKDYRQAAAWLRKAAEQGLAVAQFSLGTLYYDGSGVPQNSSQAAIWYRKAAEQGNADAQEELGGLYSFGRGVPQNEAQAAFWYRKAAEQGDAKAQFMLGSDYFSGQGVPQNNAEACFWFDLADAGKVSRINPGDATKAQDLAAKLRDDCALLLTPADLSRVQERVRKWFEEHPAKP